MGAWSIWHWVLLAGFAVVLGLVIAVVAVALTLWRERPRKK